MGNTGAIDTFGISIRPHRLLTLVAACLLLGACSEQPTAEPTALPAVTAQPAATTTPTATAQPAPTATVEPPVAPTIAAEPEPRPEPTAAPVPTPLPVEPTATPNPPPVQQNTLIQLIDPHDEPEFYCVDVRGVGATLDINAPLTAHTCKPNFDDELFDINVPATGQLYMPAYDRCVQADAASADANLHIVDCSESALQRFSFEPDQSIRLTETPQWCLGVGDAAGEPTGGPSHLRRLLRIYACDEHPLELITWLTPGPTLTG